RYAPGNTYMLIRVPSSLLTYDSISLVKYLDTIVASHSPPTGSTKHDYSPWLLTEASDILFQTAKERVYLGKIDNADQGSTANKLSGSLQPVLEEQPKWAILSEIMYEIEQDGYLNPVKRGESNNTI